MRDLTFPAGVKPSIAIKIKQADGTVYTLTDKNIQAGSVSFAFGTSNGGEFTIGGAVIGSFKFNIINRMQIWDSINYINATVEPTLTFGEKTLNMGKYWFVNHKETGSVIVCETYDALQILDEHQIHEDDIVYPTTVQDLAQKIASKRGFTVTGLLNGSIPINDPKNDDMTERECFSYLAQMTGQFVVAKGDTLVFGKYDKKTFHDAGVTFSHDLRTEPISITGVRVCVDDTNNSTGGTAGYMVEIQDNPFITKENMDSVKTALMNNIVGISFYPGTFSIRANPAIEAGDGLTLTTDKRTVKVYATTITYKLQLQESITADADDYAGDMRLSKRRKISQIAKKAAQNAISEDLKNPDSELSQAIGGGSGSSKGEVVYIQDSVTQTVPSSLNVRGDFYKRDGTKLTAICDKVTYSIPTVRMFKSESSSVFECESIVECKCEYVTDDGQRILVNCIRNTKLTATAKEYMEDYFEMTVQGIAYDNKVPRTANAYIRQKSDELIFLDVGFIGLPMAKGTVTKVIGS